MDLRSITDIGDPALEVYTGLTEARLRSDGLFIAESIPVIETARANGHEPVSLLMAEKHASGKARRLIESLGEIPVYTAPENVLEKLTGYRLTRGVLCAMRRRPVPDASAVIRNARRVAVLEDLTDSTNVGAIFRSASSLGMDAVLLTDGCCDPLCRRSVRVSMGGVFTIPYAFCGTGKNGVALLRAAGFTNAALALSDAAVTIRDPALHGADRLALWIGSEGPGLAPDTVAACDRTVIIPMHHSMDSLNAAAAAAIAFWELALPQEE